MKAEMTGDRCDLCGWEGPPSEPADFTTITAGTTEFQLCWWCSNPTRLLKVESNGHLVTAEESGISWRCSCGQKFKHPDVPQHVLEAVPNLLTVTAQLHVSGQDGTAADG